MRSADEQDSCIGKRQNKANDKIYLLTQIIFCYSRFANKGVFSIFLHDVL